jgi:hypothetical protein
VKADQLESTTRLFRSRKVRNEVGGRTCSDCHVCIRQNDQSDCGAAALATTALHYRRPIGLQQMRDLAGTDRKSASLFPFAWSFQNRLTFSVSRFREIGRSGS